MTSIDEVYDFFIIGIPESTALTVLIIIVLRLDVKAKEIVSIGILASFTVLFFRSLMLNTSIHTAAAIIILALLVAYFYKIPKLSALIASVICFILLSLLEVVTFLAYKYGLGFDIGDLAQNRWHWVISAWVKTLILCLTALIISRTKWYMRGRNTSSEKSLFT